MNSLFIFPTAQAHDPDVDSWFASEPQALFAMARHWFNQLRRCGEDVGELIHYDCPVACVNKAAFAYVNVFSAHINVGFYTGAMLDDPGHLLQGTGKRMRHVKLQPGTEINSAALDALIRAAYLDVKARSGHPS